MATQVKSRNFRQCKIFHEKLIKQHKDVESIISDLYKMNRNLLELVEKQEEIGNVEILQKDEKIEDEKNKMFSTADAYDSEEEVEKIEQNKGNRVQYSFYQTWIKKYEETMNKTF